MNLTKVITTKERIEQLILSDTNQVGRPQKVNHIHLRDFKTNKIAFPSDLHIGAGECEIHKIKKHFDYFLKEKIPVIIIGDLIDNAIASSIGGGVYENTIKPQEQLEYLIDLLTPLNQAGLLLGLHDGNHEDRSYKLVGLKLAKLTAKFLGIKYLQSLQLNVVHGSHQLYSVVTGHTLTGARYEHSKLNAAQQIHNVYSCDVAIVGHTHGLAVRETIKTAYDSKDKIEWDKKTYTALSGSYLGYSDYAMQKAMPKTETGCFIVEFNPKEYDIRFEKLV